MRKTINFLQDYLTLHVRGVGNWTNKLYSYFEEEHRRQTNRKDVGFRQQHQLLRRLTR